MTTAKKTPELRENDLDWIVDVVSAYRSKPKTKPVKRRTRRAAKIAKGGDAGR